MGDELVLQLTIGPAHAVVLEVVFESSRIYEFVAILGSNFSSATVLVFKLCGDAKVDEFLDHTCVALKLEIHVDDAVGVALCLGETHVSQSKGANGGVVEVIPAKNCHSRNVQE